MNISGSDRKIDEVGVCVSELSKTGLQPWLGLLSRPSMSSERYRFTQRLTLCSEHYRFSAIVLEDKSTASYNILWLLICIKERGSKCRVYTNPTLCFFVRFTYFCYSYSRFPYRYAKTATTYVY